MQAVRVCGHVNTNIRERVLGGMECSVIHSFCYRGFDFMNQYYICVLTHRPLTLHRVLLQFSLGNTFLRKVE
jgi:hypothetical protein